jgi:uncharacterized protein involved in type VI secretion and phage assembly
MSKSLIDWAADVFEPEAERLYGVLIGSITDNLDLTGLGRVQVSIPALPDVKPWARVAVPFAGDGNGMYAIPQVGDEVLVAFERGDPMYPYVIGSVWSFSAQPPSDLPTDAGNKIIIKTPKGHVIEIDDVQQTITITTSTDQKVKIAPGEIEVNAGKGTAKATLSTAGDITLQAAKEISLKAPNVTLDATAQLSLSGTSTTLKGSGTCTIQGGTVAIN